MPTNFRELRGAIGDWSFLVTGGRRKSILANSPQRSQSKSPTVVFMLSASDRLSMPKRTLSEDGLTYTVSQPTKVRVQLNLYGGDKDDSAMQDASLLMNSLYDPSRYLDLWLISGLMDIEETQDLTVLETGVMKQRAQCTFNLIAELSNDTVSDSFNTVETDIIRAIPEETVSTLIVNADD